ncbi:PilZ domain-containing protein [Thermodesulfobacteriota bacterium]
MNDNAYDGPERRKYFRYQIIFSPRQEAKLIIGDHTFKVLDFSEGGLRFIKAENINLDRRVNGTLVYSDGKAAEIDGEVIWDVGEEVGLQYTVQIVS